MEKNFGMDEIFLSRCILLLYSGSVNNTGKMFTFFFFGFWTPKLNFVTLCILIPNSAPSLDKILNLSYPVIEEGSDSPVGNNPRFGRCRRDSLSQEVKSPLSGEILHVRCPLLSSRE